MSQEFSQELFRITRNNYCKKQKFILLTLNVNAMISYALHIQVSLLTFETESWLAWFITVVKPQIYIYAVLGVTVLAHSRNANCPETIAALILLFFKPFTILLFFPGTITAGFQVFKSQFLHALICRRYPENLSRIILLLRSQDVHNLQNPHDECM